jgi:5-methylcytosine-specific restriction endonuclease McrA
MKYTEEQFKNAVASSTSMRQVLKKLGLKEAGGNYTTTKNRIKNLGLDTSHFNGQGWNKGKSIGPRTPVEQLLVLDRKYPYQSYKLKNRLLQEGIKVHQCECCGITKWNGQPAPLELDHINGINYDNRLENLRLLCPNCHAQTETYRGKNKSSC